MTTTEAQAADKPLWKTLREAGSREEALEALGPGVTLSAPEGAPQCRLALSEILTAPALFQVRGVGEQHIEGLSRVLRSKSDLEPILVGVIDSGPFVIDGHHRLAAYRLAATQGHRKCATVPVSYFAGSIDDAVLAALNGNVRNKLAMTNTEKQNAAWSLVVMGRFTRKQIIENTSISRPQVGIMRRTLKTLVEAGAELPKEWWKARETGLDGSKPLSLGEVEALNRETGDRWADRILKTLGTQPARNIEAWVMAQETYLGRRFEDMVVRAVEEADDETQATILGMLRHREGTLSSILDNRGPDDF